MTMLDYSEESRSSSNNSSEESEILPRSRTRQRPLLADIKENPDLYTTRRSERNRKEPTRLNIETPNDKPSRLRRIYSGSSSQEENDSDVANDDDSDYVYTSVVKKRNKSIPKMEFRKRSRVSYKEADSDDGDSDDSSLPKKKQKKMNSTLTNNSSTRDNPLLNRPVSSLRRIEVDQNDDDSTNDVAVEINTEQEEGNVIEEVLNFRIGSIGNTGPDTTYYNQKLKGIKSEERGSEEQYLIKWRGWSHIHSTWESEESLKLYPNIDGMKKFQKFKEIQILRENWKKFDATPEDLDAAQFEEERNESLLQEKMECDRIIDSCSNSRTGDIDYLIKWKTLDYRYSTWESSEEIVKHLYPEAIEIYEERNSSNKVPSRKCEVWTRRPKFVPVREQPDYLSKNPNLKLRDYQLDGINWLAKSWTRGNSVILADEMGLGKTIQTIGYLAYLFNEHNMFGPFLLVVPLSTIGSWQNELNNWAPYLNAIIYTGDAVSRQVIRECEWYFNKKKTLKFHVCITTYELLLKDKAWLNQISWAFLGIDEAHRLKNDESQLYAALISFNTNTRLLITGTPVHNSLRELWALLHFIMPDKFDRWQDFESKYNISDENSAVGQVISQLYRVLEPFLLRRTKKDVEKSLPSKSEQIIRVPMCKKQAELYKLILTKNFDALSKETRGHTSSFLNVVMELKKCCNHIQLVNPLDEETEHSMDIEEKLRYFIKSSGKMMLLDKLLYEMKENGHRVLIFSQMVRMLDIISDYLILRGWGFQRLDGSIKGSLRKQAIDHFNAEGSTDFCFLLSTRAGGLGINLATADTVVIFDSDWNPQNDLQAMARAHRIGQTKQVSVYRFVIKNSVEEKIIECAKRKMVLDHLVIQRMDSALHKKTDANKNQPFNKDELNEILKFGAADLFNQDESMDEEHELNIHDILQRAETRDNDEEVDNPANELLSAFKVVNITETAEDEDVVYIGHKGKPKLWSEIVPQEFRDKIKEEEHQKTLLELNLGPRKRKKVKSYQVGQPDDSTSDESSEEESQQAIRLSEKEIRAVVRVMKKFPRPLERIESIMIEAELIERDQDIVYDLMKRIIEGCQIVLKECDSEEKKAKAILTIGKINVPAKQFLQSLDYLDVLHTILPTDKAARLNYQLPFETKLANWSCEWETTDDAKLLVGIYEKGMDNWESIKMDPDYKLSDKILPNLNTDRPQSSHLKTRVEYLLKRLREINKSTVPDTIKSNKTDNKKSSKKPNKTLSKNPKSAEFVEESDSSKGSGRKSSKPKTKISRHKTNDKPKEIHNNIELKDSEEDIIMFNNMKGPLFTKCTKKMKPIKTELKFLEDLQNKQSPRFKINPNDESLGKCLLNVGNHIRSIIEKLDEDEKRRWRNHLWMFVNFFFDAFPKEELHRIYKKKLTDIKKKHKDIKRDDNSMVDKTKIHKNSSHKNNSTHRSLESSSSKCNFQAQSYQEYKSRIKTYTGESSRDKSFKYDKMKPYNRNNDSNDVKREQKHNSHKHSHDKHYKSEYDSFNRKSSGNYLHDNNDLQNSQKSIPNSETNSNKDVYNSQKTILKSEPNNNRDPRLSKSNIN